MAGVNVAASYLETNTESIALGTVVFMNWESILHY